MSYSFRYNGLATLDLAAFGHVRALCACCGPFGPAIVLKREGRGDHPPPLLMQGDDSVSLPQGSFGGLAACNPALCWSAKIVSRLMW